MKVPNLKWKQLHMIAAVVLVLAYVTVEARSGTDHEDDPREGRNVIQAAQNHIPLEQCIVEDGSQNLGTCMSSEECTMLGGTASGYCDAGFGVCCLVAKSCGEETSLNNTYFVDPGNNEVGACALTVYRQHSDICQIRLDILSLQLSQPDAQGNCNDDFFTVTGGTNNIPVICGENADQHLYVNVDSTGGSVSLTVDRFTWSSRTWTIRISQIECNSRYRAPSDCLQFFTETAGTVRSFNFQTSAPVTHGTRQLADQDYGICIQRTAGYCGIVWERDSMEDTNDGGYSFSVSRNADTVLPGLPGNPAVGERGDICNTDYVGIPGGIDDVGVQSDRYCGQGFPYFVVSTSTPFILFVKTDADEFGDGNNRGFKFNYQQTFQC